MRDRMMSSSARMALTRPTASPARWLVLGSLVWLGAPTDARSQTAAQALTLEQAIRAGVTKSEGPKLAAAALRRAKAEQTQARAAWLPQIDGQLSYQRTIRSEFDDLFGGGAGDGDGMGDGPGAMDFGDLPFGRVNVWNAGLHLSWELWNFGRTTNRMAAAREGAVAAETSLTQAAAQAALDAATAYYDALLAEDTARIARETLGQAEETLRTTELGFTQGTAAEFDVLRARVSRDNARVEMTASEADRDLARLRLVKTTGMALAQSVVLSTPLESPTLEAARQKLTAQVSGSVAPAASEPERLGGPADSVDAPPIARRDIEHAVDQATARAPVVQARAELRAAERALDAARAAHWPSLGLVSDLGWVNYPPHVAPTWDDWRTNFTVGVVLTVPIFSGLRTRGEIAAASSDVSHSSAHLVETERAAVVDHVTTESNRRVARATWAQSVITAALARRAYEIAQLQYREGIASQLDLIESRLSLAEAEVNRARAARDLEVATLRLRLLPDLPLTQTPSAPSGSAPQPSSPASPSRPSAPGAASTTAGSSARSPMTLGGGLR